MADCTIDSTIPPGDPYLLDIIGRIDQGTSGCAEIASALQYALSSSQMFYFSENSILEGISGTSGRAWFNLSIGEEDFIDTVIHEGAHLAGWSDETDARYMASMCFRGVTTLRVTSRSSSRLRG